MSNLHAIDAEKAVLAVGLLHPESVTEIVQELDASDFYSSAHQKIFGAIRSIAKSGEPLTIVALEESLRLSGDLEKVGLYGGEASGKAYLLELDLDLPDIYQLSQYIAIVKDRTARRLSIEVLRKASLRMEGSTPAEEILAESQGELDQIVNRVRKSDRDFVTIGQALEETIAELEDLAAGKKRHAIPTGINGLDSRMSGGLLKQGLVVVAGRPGMGKSVLGLNLAENASFRHEGRAALFSLEMNRQELGTRVLAHETRVPTGNFPDHLSGYWKDLLDAQRRLEGASLMIDDGTSSTIEHVCSKVRRQHRKDGLDLVVVDYLQLLTSRRRFENRNLEVAHFTREFKMLARELDLSIVVLSQLNRTRGPRPDLRDLRDSGAIEQDADRVIFVWREDVGEMQTELILAKNRQGPTGVIHARFMPSDMCFREVTDWEGAA